MTQVSALRKRDVPDEAVSAYWALHGLEALDRASDVELDAFARIPPVRVLNWEQFCDAPPRAPLVEGILDSGTEGVITGGPGTCKTSFALDLSRAIAQRQESWYGRALRGGDVLYIVGEGRVGLADRCRRLAALHGPAPVRFVEAPVSLMNRTTPEAIAKGLLDGGVFGQEYALVVFDTWARTGSGAEENSNDDCTVRLETACRLAGYLGDATRLFLHHPGNSLDRSRGASALEANADTVVRFNRPNKPGPITVTCAKQRDMEPFPDFTFRVSGGLLQDVDLPEAPGTWAVPRVRDLSTQERAALVSIDQASQDPEYRESGITSGQWGKACGLSGGSMDRARKRLFDLGYIREAATRRGWKHYAVTAEGSNAVLP